MGANALSQLIKIMKVIASSGPRYATFFVNTGCNRRCVYCSVPEQGSGVELPPTDWENITDRVTNWGVRFVSILGGEPTLRVDLPEIVGHISAKAVVSLTSNGDTFVGPKGKERLRVLASNGLSVLNLSLHDLHEVDRQIEILRFARSVGLIPILATVVTKPTIGRLPEIMKEANRRGVMYRYSLYQDIGGSFSSAVKGLIPEPGQLETFVAAVCIQQQKTHLIQNSQMYMTQGTNAYQRGWHCDIHKDHWVVVDNEGRLMACSEYPTQVRVLDIPTLEDPRWVQARTKERGSCDGCSYQCYMEEEGLSRLDMLRVAFDNARGLVQSRKPS